MTMQAYDELEKILPMLTGIETGHKVVLGIGEVGEWTDKLKQKYPGWNDVLKKAQKAPGSKIKTI
ncbi:MAG: hypothetical protein CM15mL2_0630 [Caudoviricetes sp.]|nr:MAG: hypothetical protein CM15mL2_0630 [Caudoviricetes sp.]